MKQEFGPEIGNSIVAAGIKTNYHDIGVGEPVMLIHASVRCGADKEN